MLYLDDIIDRIVTRYPKAELLRGETVVPRAFIIDQDGSFRQAKKEDEDLEELLSSEFVIGVLMISPAILSQIMKQKITMPYPVVVAKFLDQEEEMTTVYPVFPLTENVATLGAPMPSPEAFEDTQRLYG